ncbi:hypothetical protein EZV62_010095 [Acer yangbiense]|uniref:60S acidic ribosomal protein P1-like n=1 Tax=Acer yangbiense TaxID=1000413 RepID=A0A5C7I1D5_9ROSI|nr:hypothetical protein EZV62_010095 [Acer yangbiense]
MKLNILYLLILCLTYGQLELNLFPCFSVNWPKENEWMIDRVVIADIYGPELTMSIGEIACTYAALILHDDGIAITAEKIVQLLKAANVHVESYWPGLFAKLAEKRNIDDLIMNVGSGGGGGGAVAVSAPVGGAAAAPAPAAEEKKEEPKEESDDDMGFSLFD